VLFQAESPLAIVIFVGTNDITPESSKSLGVMVEAFEQMMGGVRRQHPEIPVYYIAITTSPLRWEVWDESQAINRVISDLAEGMANTYVIDTADQLMSAGVPDDNNYVFDRLHLSEKGYAIWAEIIRSRIFSDLNL
jgi:lysophospholipase L1-like esterase